MMQGKILFAGGSGLVGRAAARWFNERHPEVPILIGGRNRETAETMARELRSAEAVAIDLDQPHLGLGTNIRLAAIAVLAPEAGLHGLRTAMDRSVPYLNIGVGLTEVGPELALVAHRPAAAPVLLASHWMGGAATHLTLAGTERFDRVRSIRIGTVLDEEDPAGPGALEDMERVHENAAANMAFVNGRRTWLAGDAAKAEVVAIDGRSLGATAFSSFDVASLHAATGAPDVRFDIAAGMSSSRRAGGGAAIEIVVEIEGDGRSKRSRSTLVFERGQASLTGLSAALGLSRLLGLSGDPALPPGLYMPEHLADARWFMDEFQAAGATILRDPD